MAFSSFAISFRLNIRKIAFSLLAKYLIFAKMSTLLVLVKKSRHEKCIFGKVFFRGRHVNHFLWFSVFRSRHLGHFFFLFIFRSRHDRRTACHALIFLLFHLLLPLLLDELGFRSQNPLRKCIFSLQFAALVTLVVVIRCIFIFWTRSKAASA